MGDVFIERMIKKKIEGHDILIFAGVVAGVLVLSGIGFIVGFFIIAYPMITLLVAAGAIFGGYKLIGSRMLEYEYSLTNGFLSVDKIMNRASRKRLTSFECDTCEDIGVYKNEEERLKSRTFETKVFATASSTREGSWFMVVNSRKTGKTLVVFDPDEELQEGIKKFIPRQLKFEKFGRQ